MHLAGWFTRRRMGCPRAPPPGPTSASARASPGRRQEAPAVAEALRAPAGSRHGGRRERRGGAGGGAACSRSLPGAGPLSPPGPRLVAGGGRGGSGGAGGPRARGPGSGSGC